MVQAVDEPTFVKIKGINFKNGVIEVKALSRYPVLLVKDLKLGEDTEGGIGLWVEIGTEGFFKDLKINTSR
jgi:hypothetical protein